MNCLRGKTTLTGMITLNKPRVCLLTGTYYPVIGGGEIQARALVEGLAAQEYRALVVTRRSSTGLLPHERFGAVDVYRLPPAGAAQLKKWGLLFSAGLALLRLRKEYDLIFVSGFRILGLPAVLLGKLLGKRCILKSDSLGEMSGDLFTAGLARVRLSKASLPFRLFLRMRNAVLRRADAFVAISEEVAVELEAGGITADKIWHIPNSVDADLFHPVSDKEQGLLREKLGVPARARVVVYTGRLVSYKGLPLLLRVWNEIAARNNDVYLLLVGSGSLDIHNCEEELRAFVRDKQLEHSVRFTGSVPNVHTYLQAADIFAFPTENEAFGIALIEAMACGLAVVGTCVGGVKDILRDLQNGLIVPPADAGRLKPALEILLNDGGLRQQLGTAARQTVEERYTTTQVVRQYIQLFSIQYGNTLS